MFEIPTKTFLVYLWKSSYRLPFKTSSGSWKIGAYCKNQRTKDSGAYIFWHKPGIVQEAQAPQIYNNGILKYNICLFLEATNISIT